ncbi:hypothetical protein KBX18_10720 [Corynebacterium sp. CCUG 69979]|uniref:hypothetical protein n=1 Tax=Corynebacterium sp. CCUG 69979 TaxID=2823890 RepID=UPI0021091246|nr:hypothetical protein [Corynebacterium sp. CCUG 69979]MCQ4626012.1 hypothetical protein [Corynebacterium sp. CCUG 69979]
MAIPGHVLTSFQVDDARPEPLGNEWGNGVRYGRIVISSAPAHAAWSSKLREKVTVPGLRIARPVRTTDGRFTLAGFRATDFIEGQPGPRIDEAIAAALRFDDAVAYFPAPAIQRDDAWARAERAAWSSAPGAAVKGGQLTHADFLACCLFSGSLAPALSDIVPSAEPRPHGYTAALTLIDGLLAGAVDDHVLSRWSHIPDLFFLCERALEYRAILAAGNPHVAAAQTERIERVRALLAL